MIAETKEFLRNNSDLLVTKADKGNVTVLLHKEKYVSEMEKLFSDKTTYQLTSKFSISQLQGRLNRMISKMKDTNAIDVPTAKGLKCHNGIIAKAYGLPKIHKKETPFRPIVSCCGTPLYALAKFLGNIIKNCVGNLPSNIKNSYEFREKMKNVVIPENYKLVSFDVVSLFTNLDNTLIIRILAKKWNDIRKCSRTRLNYENFLEAYRLISDNTVFMFNGKTYHQVFGSPIGSPISPVLANLVLEELELTVFGKTSIKPLFFYRYVDDIVCAVNHDEIQDLQCALNSFHPKLQFTVEEENEGKLAFLDTLLIRENDGKIAMNWYHKPTWSGRYLQYHSNLPHSYKVNTVTLLAKKILHLSDEKFHSENFKLLTNTLLENGYPRKLIKNKIFQAKNQRTVERDKEKEEMNFVSVPYVKGLHEKMNDLCKNYSLKLIGKASRPLEQTVFSKLKDTTPKEHQSNIIYNIKCECDKNYVGQTQQYFASRFKQHKSDANKNTENKSALSQHLSTTGHLINFDDATVCHHQASRIKRNLLEMIQIRKTSNALNLKTDTVLLPPAYDNLLFH
jgi:predicted GIY-YIG superfamily endonuclease